MKRFFLVIIMMISATSIYSFRANNEEKTTYASYYGSKFHGRKTASGERFDNTKFTAAHKTLPFGTNVKITNPATGESVVVKINDRGPFVKGRGFDLSQAAFDEISDLKKGVIAIQYEILDNNNEESTERDNSSDANHSMDNDTIQ